MGVTLGGQSCLEPRKLLAFCRRRGLPTDWAGLPNSFTCPAGPHYGRGWLLMRLQEINALNKDGLNDLAMTDNDGGTVTIKDLIFVRARCVTPGVSGGTDAAYLVEVRDVRHLAQNEFYAVPVNGQYNVRAPAGVTPSAAAAYYDQSMKAGSPWTWQTMLDDLWAALGVAELGASPQLGFTPDGTPENFKFVGVPAWKAYNEVLERLSCLFVLDPFTGNPSIFQIGKDDPQLTAAEAANLPRRVLDDYYVESNRAKVPAEVEVYFHKFSLASGTEQQTETDTTQWSTNAAHSVTVTDPTGTTGVESGSSVAIWDDLPALVNFDGTIANGAALNSRAAERAADYYRKVKTGGTFLRRTYRGLLKDDGFLPGLKVSALAWKDLGVAYLTDVCRLPPPLRVMDDGSLRGDPRVNERLRPPDFGRATYPNYPEKVQWVKVGAVTATAQVYNASVVRIDPAARTASVLEACYVYDVNNVGLTANNVIPGRLNGTCTVGGTTRPLYVAGSGAGGGSSLTVEESDGSPLVKNVNTIIIDRVTGVTIVDSVNWLNCTNTTKTLKLKLTDNGGGSVTISLEAL